MGSCIGNISSKSFISRLQQTEQLQRMIYCTDQVLPAKQIVSQCHITGVGSHKQTVQSINPELQTRGVHHTPDAPML